MPDEKEVFWEIHHGLPREGTGDNASTRKAFAMLGALPEHPAILDIGCGPGMQTLELARISQGSITALDTHQPFLDVLTRNAAEAGMAARVRTVNASMAALPFDMQRFDVIWAEGAIYIIGLREGLAHWKPFLKEKGYVAVTHLCWLKTDIPDAPRAFWDAAYPQMRDIPTALNTINELGFNQVGHFILPDSAWWDHYYTPLQTRLTALREKYASDASALRTLDETQTELTMREKYADCYGYVFFVMQKE